ncbi:hypothetical protein [Lacibacter luteus]|uniref:hypothetical protein n=1 Tax=Lacibacter luteus TaxID=2508719 RepID=UPI00100B2CB6|nr:hypothetical protein [Lacibacter luteus]
MIDYDKKIGKLQRRRTIYLVTASFLICLNLLLDLISLIEGEFKRNYNQDAMSKNVGYFLGSHIFILFGLLLVYRVTKITRRIKSLQQLQLNDIVDAVGSDAVKE